MKKKLLGLIMFVVGCSICFSQAKSYRYARVTEQIIVIMDVAKEIPKENLSNTFLPLNTKNERFIAESGFRNIQSYFYSGRVQLAYADATKNADDPDISYIDTWSDFLKYVRGEK